MSLVRDRVQGRAPLLLVLSGALLLVMGGWPDHCTAMPKGMILANRSGTAPDCGPPAVDMPQSGVSVKGAEFGHDLHGGGSGGRSASESGSAADVGEQIRTTVWPREQIVGEVAVVKWEEVEEEREYRQVIAETEKVDTEQDGSEATNSSLRILSRPDRSVPSINRSAPQIRLRHRMHSGSAALSASVNRGSATNSSFNSSLNGRRPKSGSNLERNERSANLSHINAKIQLFIKNRMLQILPDGTVNGTQDDTSDYSEY